MNTYRFTLERYRGLSSRYTCPQCGRKHTFTRYIDTENNNNYLSERVGKCNRLDKCGYHYTPKQYFTDNPCERDKYLVEDGSLRPCGYHYTPRQYITDNPHKRDECSFVRTNRENERTNANRDSSRPHRPNETENCTLLRLVEQAKLLYQAIAKSRHYEVLPQKYGALRARLIIWRQQG